MAALQLEIAPVRERLRDLEARAEALRAELRRRERLESLQGRREVRAQVAAGGMWTLLELVEGPEPGDETRFDDLTYFRDSATRVRLGYAAASRQEVSFTDGTTTEDADDLGSARALWRRGWEFGTVAARGVRIYPLGSRAEKVVPAEEVHAAPATAEP
ncbi:MAG: hypothetical protein ABR573_03820 [Candidatus Dormibacteria bacterium]